MRDLEMDVVTVPDLDTIKSKAVEYVTNHFGHLFSNSTLIVSEKRLHSDDMKDVLLLNSIKCSGVIEKVEFLYRTSPLCYLAEDSYGMPYGTEVHAAAILYSSDNFNILPYFKGDERRFINLLADMLTQFALVYDKGIFEAYVRAFLSDENAVILAGPEDYDTLFAVANLHSNGEPPRFSHIESGGVVAIKVPKEDLLPFPYDTMFVYRIGNTVINKPIGRDEVFNMLIQGYPETRSRLFEILAKNDELRNAVEEVIKSAVEEHDRS